MSKQKTETPRQYIVLVHEQGAYSPVMKEFIDHVRHLHYTLISKDEVPALIAFLNEVREWANSECRPSSRTPYIKEITPPMMVEHEYVSAFIDIDYGRGVSYSITLRPTRRTVDRMAEKRQ